MKASRRLKVFPELFVFQLPERNKLVYLILKLTNTTSGYYT